jgi:hypothetical protein
MLLLQVICIQLTVTRLAVTHAGKLASWHSQLASWQSHMLLLLLLLQVS